MIDCCVEVLIQESEALQFTLEEQAFSVSIQEEVLAYTLAEETIPITLTEEVIAVIEEPEPISVNLVEESLNFYFSEVLTVPSEGDMAYDRLTDHVIVDATTEDFYIGEVVPGTLTSTAAWRVRRRRILSVGGEVDVQETYADGSGSFDKVWDDRLSFAY